MMGRGGAVVILGLGPRALGALSTLMSISSLDSRTVLRMTHKIHHVILLIPPWNSIQLNIVMPEPVYHVARLASLCILKFAFMFIGITVFKLTHNFVYISKEIILSGGGFHDKPKSLVKNRKQSLLFALFYCKNTLVSFFLLSILL